MKSGWRVRRAMSRRWYQKFRLDDFLWEGTPLGPNGPPETGFTSKRPESGNPANPRVRPNGPNGPISSTAVAGESERDTEIFGAPGRGPGGETPGGEFRQHELENRLDRLDRLDAASIPAGFSRPNGVSQAGPFGRERHHWHDIDHWRSRQREAMASRAGRVAVLRDWAAAAGGTIDVEGKLRLPSDLKGCLALAELRALARALGAAP
jgi:hypothetical protein